MFYERLSKLSKSEFKRLTGVKKQTFKLMTNILNVQYAVDHEFGGKPSKLVMEDKLLMTLEYWREYRTYFHIGIIMAIVNLKPIRRLNRSKQP